MYEAQLGGLLDHAPRDRGADEHVHFSQVAGICQEAVGRFQMARERFHAATGDISDKHDLDHLFLRRKFRISFMTSCSSSSLVARYTSGEPPIGSFTFHSSAVGYPGIG